ncbi:protein PECTIC ARABINOGALACTAN SYNTHESIS-RELATED-like [Salvia splendens]|uniref:protein PECTIC ARABINOGALACTAN SYNTHESIS-RELATED-like n=1 Tax=Salvia splendens TaxID=180675 RepID=UPI001C25B3A9|nr:protein PECTIC ARABINOGALACTAN SYNTHESIS-RELATED-like [Salvia splendens]
MTFFFPWQIFHLRIQQVVIYLFMQRAVLTGKELLKFDDIFDVYHFIDYLKDDVTIVRDIPEWFSDKAELFSSIRRTVKNIPKYDPAQFYIDNVLPRVKEKKIMDLKPFVDRLG